MLLENIIVESPFSQWGLDVISPIKLKSSVGHTYIIIEVYYFTKWFEAIALKQAKAKHLEVCGIFTCLFLLHIFFFHATHI